MQDFSEYRQVQSVSNNFWDFQNTSICTKTLKPGSWKGSGKLSGGNIGVSQTLVIMKHFVKVTRRADVKVNEIILQRRIGVLMSHRGILLKIWFGVTIVQICVIYTIWTHGGYVTWLGNWETEIDLRLPWEQSILFPGKMHWQHKPLTIADKLRNYQLRSTGKVALTTRTMTHN